jgi:hypothetical protein
MNRHVSRLLFVQIFAFAALVLPISSYARGRDAAVEPGKTLLRLEAATVRTPAESTPDEIAAESRRLGNLVPFRSTMDRKAFYAAKADAQAHTRPETGRRAQSEWHPVAQAQPVPIFSFDGVDQTTAGGLYPPDTHGAVGTNYFVEVTNSHLDVYTKSGTRVQSVTLASFFGYSTQTLYDPRAVYDAFFDRWVITAPAFRENSTTQQFFIACSTSGDPLGSWYFYNLNVTRNAGEFFDYPQLGLNTQGLIVTANVFVGNTLVGHHIYTFPINRMYSGGSLLYAFFTLGPAATITPPIVLDFNANAYLLSAPFSGTTLQMYQLSDLLNPSSTTLTGPTNIAVDSYGIPPDAQQPTCANLLDTLDSRFVNASTQVGNSLWNVHTVNVSTAYGDRPRPRFYQISTPISVLIQSGTFSTTGTSFDFNASIAANANGDAFVNWSATDPARGVNAQINAAGRQFSDPAGSMGVALPVYSSSSCSTNSRWGDYSAVTLDPSDPLAAWVVNETILGTTTWGSRIGKLSF